MHESVVGTNLPRAHSTACPQLAKADAASPAHPLVTDRNLPSRSADRSGGLAAGGPVSGNRKPQPQSWMAYRIGRSGYNLGAVMIRPKNQIRAELYISGDRAKASFGLLKRQKMRSSRSLATRWIGRNCRRGATEAVWPHQHEWLAKQLNDMHRVFAHRVSALAADAWRPESE